MPDPNDPVAKAENEIAELKEREKTLQKQIEEWTTRLVNKVHEIGGDENDVLIAEAGEYTGPDSAAAACARKIAELKVEKTVWPLLSIFYFILLTRN